MYSRLIGLVVVAHHERARVRLGAEHEVHEAAVREVLRRELRQQILHVSALVAVHAANARQEAGRVADDGRLECELRAVGERCDHRRLLLVPLGELALRLGVAIPVQEALDLPEQHRLVADAVDEPEQVHRDAGLIAVRVGVDDAGAVRVHLQYRSDRSVDFGVHEDDVLAVANRFEGDLRADLHVAGRSR